MNKKQHQKPLLPLEYCTVDRAARLLDCEAEDILHWAELGCIILYIKFDHKFPYYCPRVRLREGVLKEKLIRANFGFHFSFTGVSSPADDVIDRKKPINPTSRTQPKPFPTEPSPWGLFGLWGIARCDTSRYIRQYLSGITLDLTIQVFAEQGHNEKTVSYDAHAFVRLKDDLTPPTPLLIYEDLKWLQQCIHSGERLAIKKSINYSLFEEEADPVQIEQPLHHVAVSWDNARAGIFASVLHLLAKQYPDICKTKGLLAADAFKHAEGIRKKEGGHPLTLDGAQSLIDQAIKDGSVHKRQK